MLIARESRPRSVISWTPQLVARLGRVGALRIRDDVAALVSEPGVVAELRGRIVEVAAAEFDVRLVALLLRMGISSRPKLLVSGASDSAATEPADARQEATARDNRRLRFCIVVTVSRRARRMVRALHLRVAVHAVAEHQHRGRGSPCLRAAPTARRTGSGAPAANDRTGRATGRARSACRDSRSRAASGSCRSSPAPARAPRGTGRASRHGTGSRSGSRFAFTSCAWAAAAVRLVTVAAGDLALLERVGVGLPELVALLSAWQVKHLGLPCGAPGPGPSSREGRGMPRRRRCSHRADRRASWRSGILATGQAHTVLHGNRSGGIAAESDHRRPGLALLRSSSCGCRRDRGRPRTATAPCRRGCVHRVAGREPSGRWP